MKFKSRKLILSNFLLLGTACAFGGETIEEKDYARINVALVESHVLPRYMQLASTTEKFAAAVNKFCTTAALTEDDLVKAQFHQVMDAWMGVQHLNFGPIELFKRNYRFYFWPQARGKVLNAVREFVATGNEVGLEPSNISESNVAIQGLLAAEALLYKDMSPNTSQRMSSMDCSLLSAIAENMHGMATDVIDDWRGGRVSFAQAIMQPKPQDGYYQEHRDATLAFFKSFHETLQLIAEVKLKPVVADSAEAVQPRFAESHLSGRSLLNIIHNLEALQALYIGEGKTGLGDLVEIVDTELDLLLRKAFRLTIANAGAIDRPLEEAAINPVLRPKAEKLLIQVKALGQIVRGRLASALSVSVGFNSLDGD